MNSRERIQTVLEHRLPDRVPLGELWIDSHVVNALAPGKDWNGLIEELNLDIVTVPTMIYEPHEVEWIDTDKRIFRDKWGGLQVQPHEGVPIHTEPALIETPEDLARYTPPDPADSPVPDKIRKLKERYPNGEKAICCVAESGWAPAISLRGGLTNFFLDFGLRPEFVKDLLTVGRDYHIELFKRVIAAGADIILLGDDYSDKNGPMMSPKQFDEIILPCDAAVIGAIKQAGAYCIKHTDGDIRKIMDQLVSTGLDCLGPLEPVPGMELDKIFAKYPGKITVMGNINIDLLSRGTEAEVATATKRCLVEVSAIGPHIMSSANTISESVKPENFLAMVKTTQEYGTYPIDRDRILAELEGES